MWWLLVVVAGVIVAIWLIDRRRGSTGASKADDLPGMAQGKSPNTGFENMPRSGGDGGRVSQPTE